MTTKTSKTPYSEYVQELFLGRFQWIKDANCYDLSPNDMYPTSTKAQRRVADEICDQCPVRLQCLHWALVTKEVYGIWGGFCEADRAEMIEALSRSMPHWKSNWSDQNKIEFLAATKRYLETEDDK